MSDLKIQGVVEMSSEGAERAFDRVGQKSEQMAQKVTQTSAQAGQAADQIGAGADRSASEFTRAEGRIVSSIKRATTELQNMGKTASQRLELRIDTQGLDREKFEPLLANLRELEAAQEDVKRSAYGVPPAFDDIARSLVGVAAAVGGALSIGEFVGKLVDVQREFDVLNSSLITVTGSSSAAAREFAWIKQFAAETPYGLNQVTEAFVKMTSLGLDASKDALQSYGNTASAMGKSLDQMIEAVADASTGEFERLKEFGIKARQQGDQVSLTFQGITKSIGNNAAEITKYLQEIGNNQFASAMSERANTLDGAISNLGDTWDELFRTISQNNAGGLIHDSVKLASGAIADAIDILNAMSRATADNARETRSMAVEQEGIATVFETVAVVGTNVAYVLRAVGTEIGGLAAQAAALAQLDFYAAGEIGRMMKEDAEAARAAVDAQTSAILNARSNAAEFRGTIEAARKGTADYATTIGRLIEMQNAGKISAQDFRTAVESMQPAAHKADKPVVTLTRNLGGTKKAAKEAKDEIAELIAKLQAKEIEEAAKAVDDYNSAWRDYLGGLYDTARGLDEQLELYGLTEAQIAQVTLRRAEERLEMARMSGSVSADYLAALEQEVKLRREIAQASGQLEARNANAEAAAQAAQDWQRTADSIEDALIDALMEGGKSGKEYIEGLFRTMVLRPVVQALVQPLAGSITNAMGFGAPGQGGISGSFGLPPGLGAPGLLSTGLQWAGSALGSAGLTSFGAGMGMTSAQISGLSQAGLISGTAAGAGAFFASAMPWVTGALLLANAFGAFKGSTPHGGAVVFSDGSNTLSPRSIAETRELYTTAADPTGARSNQFMESDFFKRRDQGTADALTPYAQAAGAVFNQGMALGGGGTYRVGLGFSADGDSRSRGRFSIIDEAGDELTDFVRKFNKDASAGMQEFIGAVGPELRDALIEADLPAWIDDILGSLGDNVSIEQLGAVIGELSDFSEQATDKTTLWQKATRSLYNEFAALGVEMPQTIDQFNALIQSSGELGAELYALAPAFYELSNAVEQVFASISTTTAGSVRDIEMSVLDDAGKYAYLDSEIDSLLEQLNSASDPDEIQSLFEQINTKTMQAFNLLDEGEQKRLANEFIDQLYEVESIAQQRLSFTPLGDESDAHKARTDAAVAQQVAAEKQSQAAGAQVQASHAQIQAANAITAAAGAIGSAANRLMSNDSSATLAGLASALSAMRPAEVGY